MNKTTKALALAMTVSASLLIGNPLRAQLLPPDGGNTNSYDPGTNFYTYTPPPYVPGLKVAAQNFDGTNFLIALKEADPAGKYDLFFASNLITASWDDISHGTNGQTNFSLSLPPQTWGFYAPPARTRRSRTRRA